jgi:hypothetical protein
MGDPLAMLTDSEKAWLKDQVILVRTNFCADGYLMGVGIAVTPTERLIIPLRWDSEGEKEAVALLLKNELARAGALIVFTAFEAYMKQFETVSEARSHYGEPVEKMPGRIEVIHMAVETRAAHYHGYAEVRRSPGRVTLEPTRWHAAHDSEGRWANLLPRTRGVREGVN